jgi:crossover junction endodeoxyribonuclease RuvC
MTSSNSKNIIIGIDPGTRVTGYGILSFDGRVPEVIDFGCIRPPPKALLSERYLIIFESLTELLLLHKPHQMAIETQFVHKNIQSALKLGSAQGVCLIAAKKEKIPIFGYSPRCVKCSVVGTGKASKEQLKGAITRNLRLLSAPSPQDAADALAIALCHAQHLESALFSAQKHEL